MRVSKLFFSSFVVLCSVTFLSCKKDLDEEVFSFVAANNFWKTEADAEAGIIGVYERFQDPNYFGRFYYELTELPADFTTINRNDTYQQLDRWDLSATHPFISGLWNTMYQQISRANGVVKNVPSIAMNEAKKKSIVAEAKFIRAFDFFNIVRLWGPAPLSLTVVDNVSSTSLPRSSVDSIYQQIEVDLKDAETDLPATRSGAQVGRVTSGTAKTLLAWVYLTQKKWQLAADKAREVMGKYQLLPRFGDVFSVSNENNAELIFSIQFDGVTRAHSLADFSNAGGTNNPYAVNGVNVYSVDPKSDIWTKWDVTEDRRNFTVYSSVVGKNGNPVVIDPNFPSFGKYRDPSRPTISSSALNLPVLRYPDVLLIFAEAEAQAKGNPTPEAYEAINMVRRRAYNLSASQASSKDLSNLTAQQFNDAVIQERGFEFVMECKRIYDLLRTNTFLPKIKALGKPAPRGQLYPIPTAEIESNKSIEVTDQNPGFN